MKSLKTIIFLTVSSIANAVTPEVPDGTPVWASDSDIHIAHVLMGECRGETEYGKELVANSIQKRSWLRKLSPYEVVIQPEQYVGWFDEEPPQDIIWELILRIHKDEPVLEGITYMYFLPIWYIEKKGLPAWANPADTLIEGGHIFFHSKDRR